MPTPKINLLPEKLDLVLYAGDGVNIRLTVTDNAGDPIDVTGIITAQIRKTRSDLDAVADFTAASVDLGVINISLTGEQTAALITDENNFRGAWDVQWVAPGAQPVTLLQGRVECDADVTR